MKQVKPGSKEWHQRQIAAYRKQFGNYKKLAETMRDILGGACHAIAPLAMVQVRPKSLSSFAEKALRKFREGEPETHDPVNELTDLCGARVITSTQEEVEAVCDFVRANFYIREQQDTGGRLKAAEFGYRSYHFIVEVRAASVLGIEVSRDLRTLPVEIQVRTLLQHAWSDVSHDRIYKSTFIVPDLLQREAARIAALLEDADNSFGHLLHRLDSYAVNFGAYMNSEQMRAEVETLETILANEPEPKNKPGIALRIGRVAGAAGDWAKVIEHLAPYESTNEPLRAELLERLGHARCRANQNTPTAKDFKRGQANLSEIAQPEEPPGLKAEPRRAQALAQLAWSLTRGEGQLQRARDLYRLSYECDPVNPYHLLSYLEANMRCEGNARFLPTMRPAIQSAIETCRRHAAVKVELPWTYLAIGRFQLFLGRRYESLRAYAKAIQCAHDLNELDSALEITLHLKDAVGDRLPELEWVHRLLLAGKIAKTWELWRRAETKKAQATAQYVELKDQSAADKRDLEKAQKNLNETIAAVTEARERIKATTEDCICNRDLQSPAVAKLHEPVVIVAGGTRAAFEPKAVSYRPALTEAFRGFEGTIISGGTTAGIPGQMAETSRALKRDGTGKLRLISYLPNPTPNDAREDKDYEIFRVGEHGFDAFQPLQNWIDILAANVDPASVRVLGINGGEIAAFEYRLALAMGAKAGIVHKSGDAGDALLPDADWVDAGNLLRLPLDNMTLRAFVHSGKALTRMNEKQVDLAGRKVHEHYFRDNAQSLIDSGLQQWEKLREDFKNSNRQQAAYAEQILRACGFGIRSLSKAGGFTQFKPEETEHMAEMEHGRWNVERLQAGWQYGEKKDKEKRISPYLVPWAGLSEKIKNYDRRAVQHFPEILREAGLEIFRLPSPRDRRGKNPRKRKPL